MSVSRKQDPTSSRVAWVGSNEPCRYQSSLCNGAVARWRVAMDGLPHVLQPVVAVVGLKG
jgi:hypothetical protein